MKKIIALMSALGLVVPANAVNRRPMRRQVMRKAHVQRKVKNSSSKNYDASTCIGCMIFGVAITIIVCAVFIKKRDREDYVRGFSAGRATSHVEIEDNPFPEPEMGRVHVEDTEQASLYSSAHRDPGHEIPLETTGTHVSTDNPFASYEEGTNPW